MKSFWQKIQQWRCRGAQWHHPGQVEEPPETRQHVSSWELLTGSGTVGMGEKNRDYCGHFVGNALRCVAVADGVGESPGSWEGAKIAVCAFLEGIRGLDVEEKRLTVETLQAIWAQVGDSLKRRYEENPERFNDPRILSSSFLATTLLAVVELDSSYLVTYLGNGSIWLVRGDFWEFLDTPRKWPWCLTDLVLPHTKYRGEEALSGIIDHRGLRGAPSILEVQRDCRDGEIFLLTTDGISSQDKLAVMGVEPSGRLFPLERGHKEDPRVIELNRHILGILRMLKRYLVRLCHHPSTPVSYYIDAYLRSHRFDDDATLGVIISEQAKASFEERYRREG